MMGWEACRHYIHDTLHHTPLTESLDANPQCRPTHSRRLKTKERRKVVSWTAHGVRLVYAESGVLLHVRS